MAMIQIGENFINTHFVAAVGPVKSNNIAVHAFELHMSGMPQPLVLRFNTAQTAEQARKQIVDGVP
ncbi:hypothetical protein [Lysobacter sp. CA196]|uniref:hypothetical protein n=1 Tax=Lysobacter sp. CA196 TaxID=3455606 RepID=UPI003F8D4933